MSRHTELFLEAKRLIRANPQLSDEELAEQLGVKLADQRSMDTISTARKDFAADGPGPASTQRGWRAT